MTGTGISPVFAGPGVDPAVWTVLALVMGLGAAVTAYRSWREARVLGRRTRSLARAESRARAAAPRTGAAERTPARLWRRRRWHGSRRAGRAGTTGGHIRSLPRRRAVREAAAALAGLAFGTVVVDGAAAWVAGAAAGLAGWQWQRRRTVGAEEAPVEQARLVERQLPLSAELLAACLAAGSEPAHAVEAVGRATGGPLGDRLVRVAAELRLGGEPAAVWARFGSVPGCEALARCMERAGTAGVPPVHAVARLAAECRARRARAAAARARRTAVQVTGPLGLCFLPAFLAVGVAPVVIGLARSLV